MISGDQSNILTCLVIISLFSVIIVWPPKWTCNYGILTLSSWLQSSSSSVSLFTIHHDRPLVYWLKRDPLLSLGNYRQTVWEEGDHRRLMHNQNLHNHLRVQHHRHHHHHHPHHRYHKQHQQPLSKEKRNNALAMHQLEWEQLLTTVAF